MGEGEEGSGQTVVGLMTGDVTLNPAARCIVMTTVRKGWGGASFGSRCNPRCMLHAQHGGMGWCNAAEAFLG